MNKDITSKPPINKRKLYKLVNIIGVICLVLGVAMIPYNVYYWDKFVGCLPIGFNEIKNGESPFCWGRDTAVALDIKRNILIILGLVILLGLPIMRKISKYLHTQDKLI
jgi:hypothetical protein